MSKKPEAVFSCTHCDAQFSKWAGQCSECGKWGTVKEGQENGKTEKQKNIRGGKTEAFASLTEETKSHHPTGLAAWDRVLSGGLVAGSVTLVGGEPGIGKSTLLAQLALSMATAPTPSNSPFERGRSVLYVTGEESPSQVALRLKRLTSMIPPTLEFLDQTQADVVAGTILEKKPALTIVDSIQSMRLSEATGEPGNPNQVRASAAIISEAAKQSHSPVILVGQVTKDGELAGPRLLEHLVDTVLMMEGDRQQTFRLLRCLKHRFGTTDELAVFQMTEKGLEEVLDPSSSLVAHRPKNTSGSIVSCLSQGSRSFLIEIQALVTPAGYGTPLRRVNGIDGGRLSLLLAVLGRRAGVNVTDQDVFVNVVGGVDAAEPAVDLAICLAIASAKYDIPLPVDLATWGEIGLSGEVRPVPNEKGRTREAGRLGFRNILNECINLKEALGITFKK